LDFHLKRAKIEDDYQLPVFTAKGITETSSDESQIIERSSSTKRLDRPKMKRKKSGSEWNV
jgi:hypothetical protein